MVRPLVVMAARVLGPGPTRLKLVKLAHNLTRPPLTAQPATVPFTDDHAAVAESSHRAA